MKSSLLPSTSVSQIDSYHAHLYFSGDKINTAQRVAQHAVTEFGDAIQVGRWHTAPVGPHPRGSCQLSFEPQHFAAVVSWLALNREGVTVFAHPNTGDAMKDHTAHVLWLGESEALALDCLK